MYTCIYIYTCVVVTQYNGAGSDLHRYALLPLAGDCREPAVQQQEVRSRNFLFISMEDEACCYGFLAIELVPLRANIATLVADNMRLFN